MSLLPLLLILKARWKVVAGFMGGFFLLGIAWAMLTAHTYKSTAQVLVTVRAPDTVGTDNAGVTPQLSPDYLATQVDVIKSDRVAVAAAQQLGIAADPKFVESYRQAGSPGTPTEFAADILQKHLAVVPSPDSRVISISYTSPDPEISKSVANAFAGAYRDVSIDLQADPARQASTWYDKSAAQIRKQLAAAQEKLAARRAELGVTAVPEQVDVDDARLSALSQQLATAQATQAAQSARTGGQALPDAMLSPVVQSLQSDISRLEAQRRQLATFAGPNNVDYKQVTAQLATLQSELARQRTLVAQSAATGASQSATSVASLTAQFEAQRKRTIAAQHDRGEVGALEQDVTNLKSTYDQVVQRKAQSDLLGAASQTNISILSPAVAPQLPTGLGRVAKVVAMLFCGFVLGVLVALAIEFLDQRMRTPEDSQLWLGVPNLGGVRSLAPPPQGLIGGAVRRYLPGPGTKDDL